MKSKIILCTIFIMSLLSMTACKISSNKPISDNTINNKKTAYENYLKETYPNETFTVNIWQEYGTDIGGAGLPDYEGYMLRQVITDSKGNRFKVFEYGNGKYSDDYQKVLDGTIRYDEKGEQIFN